MTPELQQRLNSERPPFDAYCIHNSDDLSLSQLRELLVATADLLEAKYPNIASFHDWHEHDGFVVASKPVSWNQIRAAVATDRTLFDSRDDDFSVRIAFYSTSFDWLLRYNVDQEDESDYKTATCEYDFTVTRDAGLSGLIESVLMRFPLVLTHCKSRQWFKLNEDG